MNIGARAIVLVTSIIFKKQMWVENEKGRMNKNRGEKKLVSNVGLEACNAAGMTERRDGTIRNRAFRTLPTETPRADHHRRCSELSDPI